MFYSDFTVVTKGKNVPASHVFAPFFCRDPEITSQELSITVSQGLVTPDQIFIYDELQKPKIF